MSAQETSQQASTVVSSERFTGRVKWFNVRAGYGFITNVKTSEDVFVHHKNIQTPDGVFRMLREGEYVEFSTFVDDQGKTQAIQVTGVNQGPLMCEIPRTRPVPSEPAGSASTTTSRPRPAFRGRGRGRGTGRSAPRFEGGRSTEGYVGSREGQQRPTQRVYQSRGRGHGRRVNPQSV